MYSLLIFYYRFTGCPYKLHPLLVVSDLFLHGWSDNGELPKTSLVVSDPFLLGWSGKCELLKKFLFCRKFVFDRI